VSWLSNCRTDWLRFNLIAGLTASAVAILQAMAYVTIAMQPATVRACVVPAGDGSLGNSK
jgi:MFS superfamily sulfate permease-like transporter